MTFTAFKSPVILAGMPVSSHRDVKPQGDGNAKSSTYALSKLPSMALDFGIPAKMTAHIAIMRIAGKRNGGMKSVSFMPGDGREAVSRSSARITPADTYQARH
jgi:hypothetical protein